jgi:hypothetical protein
MGFILTGGKFMKTGFYWIKEFEKTEWQPAYYCSENKWYWLCGSDYPLDLDEIFQLGQELIPPGDL